MPRWRKLCKENEKPCEFYGTKGFQEEFGIKNAFGPVLKDEKGNEMLDCELRPVLKWNRCWSNIPKEWGPAVHELLDKIRAKYRVEGLEDDPDDPEIQVKIDQVKDKFGSLRFYYTILNLPDDKREPHSEVKDIKDQDGELMAIQLSLRNSTKAEDEIYKDIDKMIKECEERLAIDDPYYGVPY